MHTQLMLLIWDYVAGIFYKFYIGIGRFRILGGGKV